VPEDGALHEEYGQGWKITEAMPVNSVGIVTARDQLTIHITADAAWSAANEFASLNEQDARSRFDLREDSTDWSVSLAQKDLRESGPRREQVAPILYRPFDVRHTYFTGHPSGFHARPRGEVMCHLVQPNLALLAPKQTKDEWSAFSATSIAAHKSSTVYDITSVFPLWLYPSAASDLLDTDAREKRPNFAPAFLDDLTAKLGHTPWPEAILAYIYAV
ncbi:adenine specific DNA methyltransferase, partial [mine drainage metagenome]